MSETDAMKFDDEAAAQAGARDDDGVDVDITPSDIVFECPNCGHVIVIDYRGAGLMVCCPECNNGVEVPIPGGMNVSDLDKSPEELFGLVLQARRALGKAEQRVAELEAVVASLTERRTTLERAHAAMLRKSAELTANCHTLHQKLSEAAVTVTRMNHVIASDEA
ncbi:MAG: hypothetical protein FWF96_01370 [Kiritimatiellaeota bacterium]|nr:hypothetical protein [Kiritimatiellota bacterium]